MRFDFIIGNPPYQEDVINKGDRPNPIYNKFMDECYRISDVVELIHPARFLFNAGQTSKEWNSKMLSDEHFKILLYEPKSSAIFSNTDIKGGVAISIRNINENYGSIGTFTVFPELNTIMSKVALQTDNNSYLDGLVSSRGTFRFSDLMYSDYPEAKNLVGEGTGNMIVSNSFDKLSEVLFESKPDDGFDYVEIIGRTNNLRTSRYIKKPYVIENVYIDKYKVILPEANGTGTFGETLSTPIVAAPFVGATDTFLCIGAFPIESSAIALMKYIKTKFLRALLGVNKVTQHNPKSTWKSIPLQDFNLDSDIDWTLPISLIDAQLYKKYGLDQKEIEFIESHVKEMG